MPVDTNDAPCSTQQLSKRNKTRYAITLCIMILVASFLAGSLREEAFMVPAQAPSLAMCSKPFERSAKLSKAQSTIAQTSMHIFFHNTQLFCKAAVTTGGRLDKTKHTPEQHMLQANFEKKSTEQPIPHQLHVPDVPKSRKPQHHTNTAPDKPPADLVSSTKASLHQSHSHNHHASTRD